MQKPVGCSKSEPQTHCLQQPWSLLLLLLQRIQRTFLQPSQCIQEAQQPTALVSLGNSEMVHGQCIQCFFQPWAQQPSAHSVLECCVCAGMHK
ncbi:hypothetical protein V6N13_006118 [Hibiscus sabdariffa]|uniref:Uncharacterized protein n=1 Tax=Hibiscus sabdariffa TaxID=183260 RepID=A0ABR2EQH7_9ROSI